MNLYLQKCWSILTWNDFGTFPIFALLQNVPATITVSEAKSTNRICFGFAYPFAWVSWSSTFLMAFTFIILNTPNSSLFIIWLAFCIRWTCYRFAYFTGSTLTLIRAVFPSRIQIGYTLSILWVWYLLTCFTSITAVFSSWIQLSVRYRWLPPP